MSTQAVRNYERWGFLPAAQRGPQGYRLYGPQHLHAIQTARTLIVGFGWENARRIMQFIHQNDPASALAVIDACHDTMYVVNDFEKVRPFMRPDGMIFLHDTHPSLAKHLHGSYLACMKLRQQGYDIRHLTNTWWGLWTGEWSYWLK